MGQNRSIHVKTKKTAKISNANMTIRKPPERFERFPTPRTEGLTYSVNISGLCAIFFTELQRQIAKNRKQYKTIMR